MRRIAVIFVVGVFVALGVVQADAAMSYIGQGTFLEANGRTTATAGLIRDDATGITYLDYLHPANTWEAKTAYIEDRLEVQVAETGAWMSNWRLPTAAEYDALFADLSLFENITNDNLYWLLDGGMVYNALDRTVEKAYANNYNAIAVTPIPGPVWLLATGLVGLIGFRRRSMMK